MLAICGISLGVTASLSLCVASVSRVFVMATLLAVPGLLLSLVALRTPPRRIAVRGVVVALFVCLYLPTMLFSLR